MGGRRGGGRSRSVAAFAVALALVSGSCTREGRPPPTTVGPGGSGVRVLVFSRTQAFRHPSIPVGVDTVRRLGAEHGFAVDATEDAGVFSDEGLAPYDVVMWLSTTGDVLDDGQQAAFERWVRAGGGYAGVHAAADTEYGWPFYGEVVGSWFASHGLPQFAVLAVEDRSHPSTADLQATWYRYDEWYDFRTDPRATAHVLLSRRGLDGRDRPLAWCSAVGAGRTWYTALGHTVASFAEPAYQRHLVGGVLSVAGTAPVPAACAGPT